MSISADSSAPCVALTRVNLQLAQERHPEITFRATREVSVYVEVP